jgi:hypothetical protein
VFLPLFFSRFGAAAEIRTRQNQASHQTKDLPALYSISNP